MLSQKFPAIFFLLFLMPEPLVEACPGPPYDAKKVLGLSTFYGSKEAEKFLLKEGFLVSNRTRVDMADFYQGSDNPSFITTDAGLDTCHRVLEAAFQYVESLKARRFPGFVRRLLDLCQEKGGPPYRKLACYFSVPLLLMKKTNEEELSKRLGPREISLVMDAVKLVRKSIKEGIPFKVPFLSGWIQPCFRPEGFYCRSSLLSGYWKAWKWFQEASFRMDDPCEGMAGIELARTIMGDEDSKKIFFAYDVSCRDWVGGNGASGLVRWIPYFQKLFGENWKNGPSRLVWKKVMACKEDWPRGRPSVNLGKPPQVRREKSMCLFSRGETPVFKFYLRDIALTWKKRKGPPSCLDLLASGPFSSPTGRAIFSRSFKENPWAGEVLNLKAPRLGKDFFSLWMKALRLLQEPPHPQAGELFKRMAWKEKMAWTQLGGWAEIEHTTSMYSGNLAVSADKNLLPPGIISPYPKFFEALSRIALKAKATLGRDIRLFSGGEGKEIESLLENLARTMGKIAAISRKQWGGMGLNKNEKDLVKNFGAWIADITLECLGAGQGSPVGPFVSSTVDFYGDGRPRKVYVGVGRPETLYIILDRGGRLYLHCGGVLSFREFVLPTKKEMNDFVWRKWVKEGREPGPPKFTKRFRFETK